MVPFEKADLNYMEEFKYFCLKNCFYQNWQYLNIQDALLYLKLGLKLKIINNDTGFHVFKHELLMPLFDMSSVSQGSGEDFNAILDNNLQSVPVIVLVDVYYLPYRSEYNKYHASHAVFLSGYNKQNNSFKIVDWYSPYFFKGEVSYNNYMKARISGNPKDVNPFSGFKINNYWYKLNDKVHNFSPDECVMKNYSELFESSYDKKKGIYIGKYAIEQIVKYLELYIDMDSVDYSSVCKLVHDELFIYHRAIILAERYFYYAINNYKSDVDYKIIACIRNLSEKLSKLNFLLLKGSIICSKELYKRICENMIDVADEVFRWR
ncbi:MAG: BtrH N-terminal domain-containing protein [Eubacterium sp.]|nr:BtrH N-terminal domain-containing protein [Eubacterium sp.]